jgi:xylulokinase
MSYTLGIDIGTSSTKAVVVAEDGGVRAVGQTNYQFDCPHPGWVEQGTEVWWEACCQAVKQALAAFAALGESAQAIKAVGFSGQMHGLIPLDKGGRVLRPAILHCDARTHNEVEEVRAVFAACEREGRPLTGSEYNGVATSESRPLTGSEYNPVFSGFMLPSLLWMRRHEQRLYEQTANVIMSKDFLRYKLCGEIASDYSDASATLMFDIKDNKWSHDIIDAFDLARDIYPVCYDSCHPVGSITTRAARETGLCTGTMVVCGGCDQAMQAVGNGVVLPGQATVNIGSSGQFSIQSALPLANPARNTNTFSAYQKGAWYTMGATMSAGLSFKWFNSMFGDTNYAALDKSINAVPPGSGGLLFLPYLNGERTPHVNPLLSAAFFGMNYNTGRVEMARAVMEGVSYALFQCAEVCAGLGLSADELIASGGGSQSDVWLQMLADVFGKPFKVSERNEAAGAGAAAVAAVGAGMFATVREACAAQVRYRDKVWEPCQERNKTYGIYYNLFKEMYKGCSPQLQALTKVGRDGC